MNICSTGNKDDAMQTRAKSWKPIFSFIKFINLRLYEKNK